MLITCSQMKSAETKALSQNTSPEQLMEAAGKSYAQAIQQFFPHKNSASVFVGRGHNGGDALVVGRELAKKGWSISWELSSSIEKLAPLTAKKLQELQTTVSYKNPISTSSDLLIDGLLGTGANGPLRGRIEKLSIKINELHKYHNCTCVAIDVPTGVNADTGSTNKNTVIADMTLNIGPTKIGLLEDNATHYVGRVVMIPLPLLPDFFFESADTNRFILHPKNLLDKLPKLSFTTNKSSAGRVGIIAGSKGLTGAASLASLGALSTGGGLITLYVTADIYEIVAIQAPVEVMVRPIKSYLEIFDHKLDAIGVGPGLGMKKKSEIIELICQDPRPMVIDADALTMITYDAKAMQKLCSLKAPRLLTPNPGEMSRLYAKMKSDSVLTDSSLTRIQILEQLQSIIPHTLLFKGPRTIISNPNQKIAYNTTGNSGMATGGIGDVLTGICTALAARNITLFDAACLGSWMIGRAAEITHFKHEIAPESINASLIASHVSDAINSLREDDY